MASSDDYLFILGNYQLIEVLGIGAMGYVYRARQMNLDRDVAVKMLAPKLAQEINYNDLFIREARTAASLEHPHIVPVFDYGVEQNISYVAMRLLLGGSLGERIQHRLDHKLPPPTLLDVSSILTQAASALDYAHARGVIYRDIKPTNLMFDQHGVVYIVDFGIARLVGTTGSMRGGTFLGTPSFMAPEQWQGLVPTPAVDQYALGAVIYMMLTGRPPFEADAALALMLKHMNDIPREVQHYRPNLPAKINPVLHRAMAKQPEDRFPNVMAFAQAFAAVVQEAVAANEATTEFTTYALPQAAFTLPFLTPTRMPTSRADAEPIPAALGTTRKVFGRGRTVILWIETVFLVLALVLIVLLISQRPTQVPPVAAAAFVATGTESPTPPDDPAQPTSSGGNGSLLRPTAETFTATLVPTSGDSPVHLVDAPSSATSTATFTATSTLSDTSAATETSSLSATPTATPSDSPAATETQTPTSTPTSTPANAAPRPNVPWHLGSHLRVNNPNGSWLRAHPSTRATQVATLAYNNLVTATGNKFFDGRQWWWEVTASWGAVGWVEQYSLMEQ